MKKRSEQLCEGVATIDPLAGEDLDALVADAEPEELLSSILATPRRDSASGRQATGRPSAPRWRKPALAAAPLAAAAFLTLSVGLPGGSSGGGTLPALSRVAEAAAAQPAPSTSAPYQYEKTREMGLMVTAAGGQGWGVFESATTEEWIAKDGSGLERREADSPRWASPGDREAWEASGRIPFLAHGWAPYTEEHRYRAGHFSGTLYTGPRHFDPSLADLPTDPAKLAAWIEGVIDDPESERGPGSGPPRAARAMTLITELLNEPLASPQLRAALVEAEGRIPGIEYFGSVTDAIGRQGVAVGLDSAFSGALARYLVIFDPKTSQVLAIEEIWLDRPSGLKGEAQEKTPVLSSAKLFLESHGASSLGG